MNFFLDDESVGKSRAERCTELLLELNPEVEGDWYPKNQVRTHVIIFRNLLNIEMVSMQEPLDLPTLLAQAPTFTMIMHTFPIQPDHLDVLKDYAGKHLTPLVSVHSAGLYSYFRVGLPGAFPIVDTHPDEFATTDFRLLSPWPELEAFAADMTKDIETLDDHEHGHLPYVVILLHYLAKWKDTHGEYPQKYAEKVEFKKLVATGARRDNPEGGEENFDEAVAAAVKSIGAPSLPSTLKEVFEYKHTDLVST